MTWLLWLGLGLCMAAVCAFGLAVYGDGRWNGAMLALTQRLDAAHLCEKVTPRSPTRYDARELESLPAPVQRYFCAVLKDGQPVIDAVTVDLAGMLNRCPEGGTAVRSQ